MNVFVLIIHPYFFLFLIRYISMIKQEHCPGKAVYVQVIAARVRKDMKVAFGEVKDRLKILFPVKKGKHDGHS